LRILNLEIISNKARSKSLGSAENEERNKIDNPKKPKKRVRFLDKVGNFFSNNKDYEINDQDQL